MDGTLTVDIHFVVVGNLHLRIGTRFVCRFHFKRLVKEFQKKKVKQ